VENLQSVFPFAQAQSSTGVLFPSREIRGQPEKNPLWSSPNHVAQYTDLHCHLLPGLDDGAPDLPTSMEMMDSLAGLGFAEICVTPHQRNGLFIPTAEAIGQSLMQFRMQAQTRHPGVVVRLGAENYWDDIFIERLRSHTVPCYEGNRAFLFEVNPMLPPPRLDEALFEIRLSGCLPVAAHPERYLPVQRDLAFAEVLARQAALVVDLEALAGSQSRGETKAARRLVEEGLAHAVASDMHAPEDLDAVASGIEWIRKRRGSLVVTQLLEENPRRILAGELP
jgi:protein-tyrosine phosphatase